MNNLNRKQSINSHIQLKNMHFISLEQSNQIAAKNSNDKSIHNSYRRYSRNSQQGRLSKNISEQKDQQHNHKSAQIVQLQRFKRSKYTLNTLGYSDDKVMSQLQLGQIANKHNGVVYIRKRKANLLSIGKIKINQRNSDVQTNKHSFLMNSQRIREHCDQHLDELIDFTKITENKKLPHRTSRFNQQFHHIMANLSLQANRNVVIPNKNKLVSARLKTNYQTDPRYFNLSSQIRKRYRSQKKEASAFCTIHDYLLSTRDHLQSTRDRIKGDKSIVVQPKLQRDRNSLKSSSLKETNSKKQQ